MTIIQEMRELSNGVASQEDLKEVIKLIFDELNTITKRFNSLLQDNTSKSFTSVSDVRKSLSSLEIRLNNLISNLDNASSTKFKELSQRLSNEIARIEYNMPKVPDLTAIENKLKEIEDSESEDDEETREDIKSKLESFTEESDKLSIDAIGYLRDELDQLKKKTVRGGGAGGGGGSTGARNVSAYDLSSSLNGVLKTFSLPAFWRIIEVSSSSFPYAFRPTIDYTVDATAMTITFTSEIEASTTLNTGQTLLVIYAE